jgi:hypothetical protein
MNGRVTPIGMKGAARKHLDRAERRDYFVRSREHRRRYDDNGGFSGTRWINSIECEDGQEEGRMINATKSQPSDGEISLLNALVANLMARL